MEAMKFFLDTIRTIILMIILFLLATECRAECLTVLQKYDDQMINTAEAREIARLAVIGTRYTVCEFRSVKTIVVPPHGRVHELLPPIQHWTDAGKFTLTDFAGHSGRISWSSTNPYYCPRMSSREANIKRMKSVL